MMNFATLFRLLSDHGVAFVIVGGAAAVIHGSSRLTEDLDVVNEHSPENSSRLVQALAGQHPYLRGAPPGLPFRWSDRTVAAGLNFMLETDLGPLDLLGEIVGGGGYHELIEHTVVADIFGVQCPCLDLESLIRVKQATGRPKDLEAISELEAMLEEQRGDETAH